MNDASAHRPAGSDLQRPITIAVLALGGQGGAVLVDWIIDLAERNDFLAQSTSVPGVAQRTGATIYYIELLAAAHARTRAADPVFALVPVPGEVDIVIAAELMEAGRAIQRGLVTPERTTLIASTHREFATTEKLVPGNGIADSAAVIESATRHARRFLHDDLQALTREAGSVISASLLGALAGSGELPFPDQAYRDAIARAGLAVQASLKAWEAGCRAIRDPIRTSYDLPSIETEAPPLPVRAAAPAVERLRQRIVSEFPASAHPMLGAGLQRVLEFQDLDYGAEYLDRVLDLHLAARSADEGRGDPVGTIEAARWIAVAMAYDDIIRVADLKRRGERFRRIRSELGASPDGLIGVTEYFHPRLQELLSMLPSRLGRMIERSPRLCAWLGPRLSRSRRVRSHTIRGQLLLSALAMLRRWRRMSLRHDREQAHLNDWLARVRETFAEDHGLAVEMIRCRRAVKGYSDTHARGLGRFDRLMDAAQRLRGRQDAANALALLIKASLADADGKALQTALAEQGLQRPTPGSSGAQTR